MQNRSDLNTAYTQNTEFCISRINYKKLSKMSVPLSVSQLLLSASESESAQLLKNWARAWTAVKISCLSASALKPCWDNYANSKQYFRFSCFGELWEVSLTKVLHLVYLTSPNPIENKSLQRIYFFVEVCKAVGRKTNSKIAPLQFFNLGHTSAQMAIYP